MPKILKNKKLKKIVSKKKLKSKNRRKLNIRSKKLKSKKYQGVIQRKSKKEKGGGNGIKKSRGVMRGGIIPRGNGNETNVYTTVNQLSQGFTAITGKSTSGADRHVKKRSHTKTSHVNSRIYQVSPNAFNNAKFPKLKLEPDEVGVDYKFPARFTETEIETPQYLTEDEIIDKYIDLEDELIIKIIEDSQEEIGVGGDALFVKPEDRILTESLDMERVGKITYTPKVLEEEKKKIQELIETEKEKIEEEDLFELFRDFYDIFKKEAEEAKVKAAEAKEKADTGAEAKAKPPVDIKGYIIFRFNENFGKSRINEGKYGNLLSKLEGTKSGGAYQKKNRNKFSIKKTKSKQLKNKKKSQKNLLKYQKSKLNKKQRGGTAVAPAVAASKFIVLKPIAYHGLFHPNFPNTRKYLLNYDTGNAPPNIDILFEIFYILGQSINKEDILEDYQHDFTRISPEDNSLIKFFQSTLDTPCDYNSRINFIPLHLEERRYWDGHDNSLYNDLFTTIMDSISLVDAGTFVIGGYSKEGKEGEDCTKHLSNIIDPATTGKNTNENPYLGFRFFESLFGNNLRYFFDCILAFITGIERGAKPSNYGNAISALKILSYEIIEGKIHFGNPTRNTEWNGSQAPLANAILGLDADIEPRSKRTDTLLVSFLESISADADEFKKLCMLMKYIGDKSHIIQAILYILLLKDTNEKKPKVVIKTLDRLLFKCVSQVINFTTLRKNDILYPDENKQKFMRLFFKEISENLGVMYGYNFTVANVFKRGIEDGKMYASYYSEMSKLWTASLDDLGEYALYSNFKDRVKSISEFMLRIKEQFEKEIRGGIKKSIFETIGVDNTRLRYMNKLRIKNGYRPFIRATEDTSITPLEINSFMILYQELYPDHVIPFPFYSKSERKIVFVNLFPTSPNAIFNQHYPNSIIKENFDRWDFTTVYEHKLGISSEYNPSNPTDLHPLTEDFLRTRYNSSSIENNIYNYMLSCRRFLERNEIFRKYLTYSRYITFYEKTKLMYRKYLLNIPFVDVNRSFLPGYSEEGIDLSQILSLELISGIRGMYTKNQTYDTTFGDRIQRSYTIDKQKKYFPYFKIGMEHQIQADGRTISIYNTKKDPYGSENWPNTFPPTPWPCEGGIGKTTFSTDFNKPADIRYSKDPSKLFKSLTFINNLFSDQNYKRFLSSQQHLLDYLSKDGRFLNFNVLESNYIKRLKNFKNYYEKVKELLTLDDTDIGLGYSIQDYFDKYYKDLSELFMEYYVEAYILGVPLIYFMKIKQVAGQHAQIACNYKDYETGHIPLEIMVDDTKTVPLKNDLTNRRQILYLSNKDYNGNLKSILTSIRTLYEECKEVIEIDEMPTTHQVKKKKVTIQEVTEEIQRRRRKKMKETIGTVRRTKESAGKAKT